MPLGRTMNVIKYLLEKDISKYDHHFHLYCLDFYKEDIQTICRLIERNCFIFYQNSIEFETFNFCFNQNKY